MCCRCTHRNYSTSKRLKASPQKSQILCCDTFILGVRYVDRRTCGKNLPLHPTFANFIRFSITSCGPGSVVGIATAYGLECPGVECRWGRYFFAPVQTGPEAHPASCTVGTWSFPGVRCGRCVTLTPHPF